MSDARLRELERRWRASGAVDDEAAWIAARLQAGDLAPERLALAALLGHEPALRAGGAPLPDPFAGRDEEAWRCVEDFRRGRDARVLRPLLDDRARRADCGHPHPWRHLLAGVAWEERTGARWGFQRCWPCGERIGVAALAPDVFAVQGKPPWLRGLPLLDHIVLPIDDPAHEVPVAERVLPLRWLWGLGAHPFDASLRAAIAVQRRLLETRRLERPAWRAPVTAPVNPATHGVLARLVALARQPLPPVDPPRFEPWRFPRTGAPDDLALLIATAQAAADDPLHAGAVARGVIHRTWLMVEPDDVLRRVRAELVPWALGLADPLAPA